MWGKQIEAPFVFLGSTFAVCIWFPLCMSKLHYLMFVH